jgi:RHS repeat-associated protein
MYFDSMNANNPRQSPCVRDSAGLVCVLENALRENFPPRRRISIRTYDEAGRVTSVTDSSGVRSGLQIDNLGRVTADTNGLGFVAKHAFGANVETVTDRNGKATVITKDALGRTVSIKDPDNNVTAFTYKAQADGTERDSVAYPDNTWEVTVADKAGRTLQKLDKRRVTQSFTYGNDWGANTIRYAMATKPTLEVVYTRNAKGQVEKIERTEGGVTVAKTEYAFDDAGRVLSQKQTVGTDVKITSYAYDLARRSVTFTLPDGTTRTKVLDERGRLDSVYLDGAMVANYLYANNAQASISLGNGIHAGYGRDAAGRLDSLAYGLPGQDPILRHDLGWDVAGQLAWTKKTPDAIADERYGIDQQGQLTEWKTGALDASNEILTPVDSLGWAMDSRGNWTNVYDSKATVDTRTHSGANAINARNGVNYTYDDAGNLLSDGVNTYEWALDGMLAKVSTASGSVEYTYDGLRRMVKRVEKNASAVVTETDAFVWDGWQLAQELRNGVARSYAYGKYIDDQIAVKTTGGVYYMHRSYNQSTEAVTNASGALVERYIETNPYGGYVIQNASGQVITSSLIGNRSVFQGAPMTDAVSGLVYLRNRWYSPQLGRFVTRDPAGVFVNPGFNLYQSFNSNPEIYRDPLGLQASKCCVDQPLEVSMKGKTSTGISMYFHASFKTDKCKNCDSKCCEFRQEVSSRGFSDGSKIEYDAFGNLLQSGFHDDGYKRGVSENSYAWTPTIEQFYGWDYPGFVNAAQGSFVQGQWSFRGYIYDTCSNKQVGARRLYGFSVEGTIGGNLNIQTWGF